MQPTAPTATAIVTMVTRADRRALSMAMIREASLTGYNANGGFHGHSVNDDENRKHLCCVSNSCILLP